MGIERAAHAAMIKFCNDEPLTGREWKALGQLTLIDRSRLLFEPGNVRWAKDQAERDANIEFYRSL